jgi:hypothetical protein
VIQRRTMAGIAIAAGALTLAGCGFQAPPVTNNEQNSAQSRDLNVGSIAIRNAYVTTSTATGGKPSTYIGATFVNSSTTHADTLTGISTQSGSVTLAGGGGLGGGLEVPPRGVPVVLNEPVAASQAAGPSATLAATTTPAPGRYVTVTFTFSGAGSSPAIRLPVVPDTATTAASSPVPTETATPPTESGEPASD